MRLENALYIGIENAGVNVAGNKALSDFPADKVADLKYFPQMILDGQQVVVTRNLLEMFGLTADEAVEIAKENTAEKLTCVSMMRKIGLPEVPGAPKMMVCQGTSNYGAGVIAVKECREKIADIFGGECFVIPSSVHEVIAIDTDMDPKEIRGIIGDVNETPECLGKDEVLSYNLYKIKDGELYVVE